MMHPRPVVTCFCARCGEAFTIVVPVTAQAFKFLIDDFLQDHGPCRQTEDRDAAGDAVVLHS